MTELHLSIGIDDDMDVIDTHIIEIYRFGKFMGSGFKFDENRRDYTFEFKSHKNAERAKEKLKNDFPRASMNIILVEEV